jgi:hypothetical protein
MKLHLTPRVTSTVAIIALTPWIGGLLALGAIVAPVVFASVPFAQAADAMTTVFARFDKLAMGAAAVLLATEAVRARSLRFPIERTHLARIGVTVALVAMAVADGLWVTPTIARLHSEGAVRGVGEAGEALASAHSLAETLGKAQALFAVALIALHFATIPRDDEAPESA